MVTFDQERAEPRREIAQNELVGSRALELIDAPPPRRGEVGGFAVGHRAAIHRERVSRARHQRSRWS
jgi:hypothetical protein